MDRRALRENFDAAERREEEEDRDDDEEENDEEPEAEDEGDGGDDDDDGEEKPVAKKKPKKAAAPKTTKPRSRSAKQVRQKVVWGVFDNSNKEVQTFPYPDRKAAEEFCAKLSAEKKGPFFIQAVRKPLEEK
jgi:hypothetical protein